MADRKSIDWEAIEREYRLGQLSVVEIARQHGISHTAIQKKAKAGEWTRSLVERVRKRVADRLVAPEVAAKDEEAAVEVAAATRINIVREHQASIGRGQKLALALFSELEEATENREAIDEAIEAETLRDKDTKRRSMMQRAVALPSRATTLGNLASALKTLVGLERQAFNLSDGPGGESDAPAKSLADFYGNPQPMSP